MADTKKRLGRGLAHLVTGGEELLQQRGAKVSELRVSSMEPGGFQPRSSIDEAGVADLAESIARCGVLQPIVVRRKQVEGEASVEAEVTYEIIAGERRWRAAQKAELKRIPAVVTTLSDAEATEVALVENVQREDLSAPDMARSIVVLMREFGYSQQELGDVIGISRPAVANWIRLLKLDDEVLGLISDGSLSAGHGRALLRINDVEKQREFSQLAIDDAMSVRELEKEVQKALGFSDRKVDVPERVSRRMKNLRKSVAAGTARHQLHFKPRTASTGSVAIEYRSREMLDKVLDALEGGFGSD